MKLGRLACVFTCSVLIGSGVIAVAQSVAQAPTDPQKEIAALKAQVAKLSQRPPTVEDYRTLLRATSLLGQACKELDGRVLTLVLKGEVVQGCLQR